MNFEYVDAVLRFELYLASEQGHLISAIQSAQKDVGKMTSQKKAYQISSVVKFMRGFMDSLAGHSSTHLGNTVLVRVRILRS